MKAWDDLENDVNVSLYWTGDEREPTSYWYLDHGCKIERFVEDGRIEIKNVMTAGDWYEDVTEFERSIFEENGWLSGCYCVCINTYTGRVSKVEYLMSTQDPSSAMYEALSDRKEKLMKKLNRYYELLNNINTFAN